MKLSVIVPSYNRAALVAASVSSICRIPHRPLEIVVVDDGSTDETPAKEAEIRGFCQQENVELQWIRQGNAGAAAARNTGFRASTGDLVQWVDADDTVQPDGVAALLAVLSQRQEVDVAYGLVSVIAPDGAVEGVMGKAPSRTDADYFDYLWHTMGAVYRRECVTIPGPWNPVLTMPDDWDFSSRMRISGIRYFFTGAIVGNYQKYEEGTLTITGFNEAKCFNVIEAVLSIREALQSSGKYSRALQQRCFNRAFVHAVELGANRSRVADKAFRICREIGSPDFCLRICSGVLALVRIPELHRRMFLLLRRDLRGKPQPVEQATQDAGAARAADVPGGPTSATAETEVSCLNQGRQGKSKLSIVCPTHNRARFLAECVRSVLEHGRDTWEFLVVDDGSTDQTEQVVAELIAEHPQWIVRYLRQPERLGAPAARNRGVREAHGDYVMFMDSDDVACADGIGALVDALDAGVADFAYGRVAQTDVSCQRLAGREDLGTTFSPKAPDITTLNWHTMGAVYRRSFVEQTVGLWNETLEGSQDWEFQARVKLARGRGAYHDCLVGYWRHHEEGRIGGAGYRPSYVNSVMLAALAIEKAAAHRGLLTTELRRALCHRLVNHQLEAAAHGNNDQARTIAREARRLSRGLFPEGLLVPALGWTPGQWADKALFRFVRGGGWRASRQ